MPNTTPLSMNLKMMQRLEACLADLFSQRRTMANAPNAKHSHAAAPRPTV